MSGGRLLPIVGARTADADDSVDLLPPEARSKLTISTVSVVLGGDARLAVDFAEALVARAAELEKRVGVVSFHRGGALAIEREGFAESSAAARFERAGASLVLVVRTPRERTDEAIERAFGVLASSELVVALGADLPARRAPRLTVAVTGGLSPLAWAPSARSLRGHFDLELADPRREVARGLVERLVHG